MTLGRFTAGPLNYSTVGFDRFFDTFDTLLTEKPVSYPPHNTIKIDENCYQIELAVAGFDEDELTIDVLKNKLTIKGAKKAGTTNRQYLHQGIANRSFERIVTLSDTVRVNGATLKAGILTVDFENVVPEELQPKRIFINAINVTNIPGTQLLQE
jgi:molecular chaperone IbpA